MRPINGVVIGVLQLMQLLILLKHVQHVVSDDAVRDGATEVDINGQKFELGTAELNTAPTQSVGA